MSKQSEFPVPVADVEDGSAKARRAPEPQPIDPEKLPALPYYERHPEHRPRRQSARQLRRQRIREGY
jgi:hypothetical protein